MGSHFRPSLSKDFLGTIYCTSIVPQIVQNLLKNKVRFRRFLHNFVVRFEVQFVSDIFISSYGSTRPPSCRCRQACRRRRCAATATLPLPLLPPRCQRCQRHALTKLMPPPPSWPPPLMPRSCQAAAAAAAKLAAASALSPRFRHHRRPLRFNCYHHCYHRCRFRAFS